MFAGKLSSARFHRWPLLDGTDPDYRIPQILYQLGCLRYSPPLESHIRRLKPVPSGSTWEIEIRGTSIWCVELIRREIERRHPEVKARVAQEQSVNHSHTGAVPDRDSSASPTIEENRNEAGNVDAPAAKTTGMNAILIDFFLYDTMKTLESQNLESIPHHRTRSIWY